MGHLAVLLACSLAVSPAIADEVNNNVAGKYICVLDRAAGIQTSTADPDQKFAGRINMPPEEQKFFIDIIDIPVAKDSWEFTRDKVHVHNAHGCSTVYNLDKMETEWNTSVYPALDFYGFDISCLAKNAVKIEDGKYTWVYYGVDRNLFRDFEGDRFQMYGGKDFSWATFSNEASSIREGRCDLVSKAAP